MEYEKQIKSQIGFMNSLQNLVEIYGEIASIRMMKIREFVLKNRDFLNSIHNIFRDALASYAAKLAKTAEESGIKKGERVTFLAHNGKTVAVLVSANTGFYGDVVQNTFKKFLAEIRENDYEVTIIGKIGLSLFLEREPKKPYTYFNLPDYGVDAKKLSDVIKHLVQYEEIRVYHGKYISVVTQEPEVFDIEAGAPVAEDVENPKIEYIFEPSVEKILQFFETEIFASLFDQTIRESQLAKFASRIMAMDSASENIKKEIDNLSVERLKAEHRVRNRKQLNSLVPAYKSLMS
jgi:F-type H+-transporting ATPase subunit gamma